MSTTETDAGCQAEGKPGNEAAPRSDGHRRRVTVALLLAMTVTALEQTVVSTAMPSIIAALQGLDIYPWVFSAYLLAATVTTPLYGKLADRLGRKKVLLFGLAAFGAGSVLSGLARSMPELILMRVVQGVGAGAVAPIVLTMLGDMFTLDERARVQGLFSAVWGVSSLAGPALGGVLTDQLSWRWVFYVTAPFAAVAFWILLAYVREMKKDAASPAVDWSGAAMLSLGSAGLLLAVLRGHDQTAAGGAALVAVSAVLLGLFVWNERRAADPILPIDLMLTPNVFASVVGSFLIGALLFGIDTYIPLYVQGVQGGTATRAGRTITPLFLTWSVSVAVAAYVVRPLGFRRTALGGSLLITSGVAALAVGAWHPGWAGPLFLAGMVVIGLGMGPTSLSLILDVQNSVEHGRRGTATGAVIFARTMGGALGVGLLGASLGLELARRLAATATPGIDVAAALRPETHARLAPEALAAVQAALGQSLRLVFLEMTAVAVVVVVSALGLRGGRAVSHADAGSSGAHSRGGDEGLSLAAALEH